ncbi:ribonuclease II, chloroplastic/mitochondrial-like [Cajanus cajan]|uniref:ribonuclease II, chloroplastic/mitochondrial-like n=1 Tax=Cajanus cajan TaxID=3821 RepID=UPI0010FB9101|nr:ribonuclease II, chloroplastic/mitochondrial-like [Cajanus cajan]
MSSQDKPPKSSWTIDEKIWNRIESLEAYAIDTCKNDEQRKTAGMILKEMGLAKVASSSVKLLIDIGYFPVHINLDLLKLGIPTYHSEEIISAAQSLLLDSSDPDEVGFICLATLYDCNHIYVIFAEFIILIFLVTWK